MELRHQREHNQQRNDKPTVVQAQLDAEHRPQLDLRFHILPRALPDCSTGSRLSIGALLLLRVIEHEEPKQSDPEWQKEYRRFLRTSCRNTRQPYRRARIESWGYGEPTALGADLIVLTYVPKSLGHPLARAAARCPIAQ